MRLFQKQWLVICGKSFNFNASVSVYWQLDDAILYRVCIFYKQKLLPLHERLGNTSQRTGTPQLIRRTGGRTK